MSRIIQTMRVTIDSHHLHGWTALLIGTPSYIFISKLYQSAKITFVAYPASKTKKYICCKRCQKYLYWSGEKRNNGVSSISLSCARSLHSVWWIATCCCSHKRLFPPIQSCVKPRKVFIQGCREIEPWLASCWIFKPIKANRRPKVSPLKIEGDEMKWYSITTAAIKRAATLI